MNRFTRRLATLTVAASLLAPVLVAANASEIPEACKDRGSTFAKLLQPASGQATVNAGPLGSVVVGTGAAAPSVTLSLSGSMDVVIEHSCLLTMGLIVTKDHPAGGPATVVHTASWDLDCDYAKKTEAVKIGLDGGHYRFALNGTSCTGIGFKNTPEGGLVGDPPIL